MIFGAIMYMLSFSYTIWLYYNLNSQTIMTAPEPTPLISIRPIAYNPFQMPDERALNNLLR